MTTAPPLASELIARTPELANHPELAGGRLVPIAIRVGEPGDPAPGTVLELRSCEGVWDVRYDDQLVGADDAQLLVTCLRAVLAELVDRPDSAVADVDLLGPSLRHRVLEEWNNTDVAVPAACVHRLFEEQVDRTPDATALDASRSARG